MSQLLSRFSSFLHNKKGNTGILLALSAVPLLIAAGSAIDYIGAVNLRTRIQAAVDATALAVARAETKTNDERIEIGQDYFKSNMDSDFTVEPDIKINPDSITVSINTERKTAFMRLAGIDEVPIDVMAEVTRAKSKNAEVVLVLDYSYSMVAKNKYVSMRNAAGNLIDKLAESEVSSLKFGLVPFSAMVRLSMPKSFVTQNSATPTWTGCTQDRKYPYNTGDTTPASSNDTKWGYIDPIGENAAPYNCQAYDSKKLDVVPLTDDLDDVKSRMQAMQPVGNTNIPLGVEFGWHVLSSNEPFTEGAPYDDTETMKFMIVLTDGVQTSRQWGPKNNRSVDNGNANLVTLCSGVKDRGITVYTIAYDVKSAAVTDLLKACAGSNYFNSSDSAEEIDAVFNEIASRIGNSLLRIAR